MAKMRIYVSLNEKILLLLDEESKIKGTTRNKLINEKLKKEYETKDIKGEYYPEDR